MPQSSRHVCRNETVAGSRRNNCRDPSQCQYWPCDSCTIDFSHIFSWWACRRCDWNRPNALKGFVVFMWVVQPRQMEALVMASVALTSCPTHRDVKSHQFEVLLTNMMIAGYLLVAFHQSSSISVTWEWLSWGCASLSCALSAPTSGAQRQEQCSYDESCCGRIGFVMCLEAEARISLLTA